VQTVYDTVDLHHRRQCSYCAWTWWYTVVSELLLLWLFRHEHSSCCGDVTTAVEQWRWDVKRRLESHERYSTKGIMRYDSVPFQYVRTFILRSRSGPQSHPRVECCTVSYPFTASVLHFVSVCLWIAPAVSTYTKSTYSRAYDSSLSQSLHVFSK
jgi:hypothetical protein